MFGIELHPNGINLTLPGGAVAQLDRLQAIELTVRLARELSMNPPTFPVATRMERLRVWLRRRFPSRVQREQLQVMRARAQRLLNGGSFHG